MPPKFTAGTLSNKIIELRSRITVQEQLKTMLEQNYMPSDSGPGELVMYRADGAPICREHLKIAVDDIDERIDTLRMELQEFEDMPIADPRAVEPAKLKEDGAEVLSIPEPEAPISIKEKRNVQAKRIGPSPAPSK